MLRKSFRIDSNIVLLQSFHFQHSTTKISFHCSTISVSLNNAGQQLVVKAKVVYIHFYIPSNTHTDKFVARASICQLNDNKSNRLPTMTYDHRISFIYYYIGQNTTINKIISHSMRHNAPDNTKQKLRNSAWKFDLSN